MNQEQQKSFFKTIEEYKNLTDKIVHISLSEKIDILFQKANNPYLISINALDYIINLKNIMFTEEEKKENINIKLIKNNELENNNIVPTSMIISINVNGFEKDSNSTLNYLYHPSILFQKISSQELEEKIKNGTYVYL